MYLIPSYLVIWVKHTYKPGLPIENLGIEYIWVLSWVDVQGDRLYMY